MIDPGQFRPARSVERHSERGAILPIMALLLVALLTMAAIAVDLGGARETRRRNQGSVDAAALGAAQDLPGTGSTPLSAARATAVSVLASNFGLSDAQAAGALNTCGPGSADPNALAVQATAANAQIAENCISFDSGAGQIRVYYRDTYKTAFGKVVGATTLAINNGATAEKSARSGFGGVLPFGLPAGAGVGEVCLKTGPPGGAVGVCHTDPLNTHTTGNEFYLDVAQYGNSVMGTSARCSTADHDALLRDNMAMGIDHLLTNYAGNPVHDAYSACTYNSGPNEVDGQTGAIANLIKGPILTDVSTSTCPPSSTPCETDKGGARLQRDTNFVCTGKNTFSGWPSPGYDCGTVEGVSADDVPLWNFIGVGNSHVGLTDVPTSCAYAKFQNQIVADTTAGATVGTRELHMRGLLNTCFSDYETGDAGVGCAVGHVPCQGKLFGFDSGTCKSPKNVDLYDLQCTTRFGYAPVVCNTLTTTVSPYLPCLTIYPSGGSGSVLIVARQPVYMQRLTDNNAHDDESTDPSNALDFEPGVKYSRSSTSDDITNITAFSFDRNMLPGKLGDPDAPNETDVNVFVSLVR